MKSTHVLEASDLNTIFFCHCSLLVNLSHWRLRVNLSKFMENIENIIAVRLHALQVTLRLRIVVFEDNGRLAVLVNSEPGSGLLGRHHFDCTLRPWALLRNACSHL